MATVSHNIFLTRREKLHCYKCKRPIAKGQPFMAEKEDYNGLCFHCSPFVDYYLLPPGDVAMTRRSKKYSALCGVVLEWNNRRRRYERKGQFVEPSAIAKAQKECEADKEQRAVKNAKAAKVRQVEDAAYILAFGKAIRAHYPNCPVKREYAIAQHACEKYSGRVGRTAAAKQFDATMIDRAVEAHVRHTETNYDNQFGKGLRKREIRAGLSHTIKSIMASWR